jgi:hypothetical protein
VRELCHGVFCGRGKELFSMVLSEDSLEKLEVQLNIESSSQSLRLNYQID